ncbi:MAG TPA: hypothetical protein VN154_11915 [Rhizomicrobium sp.]|nr:hypothetical protein [Rhizomicrobium sp.]
MRHSLVFGLCVLVGAAITFWLAEENLVLAVFMGAALGASIAVMIVAFPLDLSYREPLRGKREVHVVLVERKKD